MTPTILIHELAEEIRKSTANFIFQAEYQEDKKVSVYEGFFPEENFQNETYLPFIVVELRGVTDTDEGSFADIGLMFATYGGENAKYGGGRPLRSGFRDYGDGWLDLHNLAETVRQDILKLPSRILANKFPVVMPIEYRPQPNQPYPFFFGDMIITFEIGQPVLHLRSGINEF